MQGTGRDTPLASLTPALSHHPFLLAAPPTACESDCRYAGILMLYWPRILLIPAKKN